LIGIDGTAPHGAQDALGRIAAHKPGSSVLLRGLRGGGRVQVGRAGGGGPRRGAGAGGGAPAPAMTILTTRTFGSRQELDAALTARLARALSSRVASAVMLSGGTTPMNASRTLARGPLTHDDRLHVLFSDE